MVKPPGKMARCRIFKRRIAKNDLSRRRVTVVGVPRHTKENRALKPFFVGCAQSSKLYKSPRSLLNTGSAGFCTHGGQRVVTVVGIAEEKRLLGIKKGSQQIYNIPVQGSIIHVAYGKLYLVSSSFPSAKHATKRIICLSFLSYGLCVSISFRR